MQLIREIHNIYPDGSAVMDLTVSTTDDLPETNAIVGTFKTAAGSTAKIIQAGLTGTLDDDGKWYDESGNEIGGDDTPPADNEQNQDEMR